jgi:hypothetical protein
MAADEWEDLTLMVTYLFIIYLFNDTVSSLDYVASSERQISE